MCLFICVREECVHERVSETVCGGVLRVRLCVECVRVTMFVCVRQNVRVRDQETA